MNNEFNFDPNTGQPINNNVQPNVETQNTTQPTNTVPVQPTQVVEQQPTVQPTNIQNIATVEQNKQQFINNEQSNLANNKEEKKEGINFTLIFILLALMFLTIFFLFPFLSKYI